MTPATQLHPPEATAPIRVPVVERMFQLAQSGAFSSCEEIAEHLRREGYVDVEEHLWCCNQLRRQLLGLCRSAAGNSPE